MHTARIEDLVALPLTGLRYALADKLLKINTPDRFTPAKAEQVDGLVQALEAAEININQLWNIKFKTEDLLAAIAEKKHVADHMWDLIQALKMIVADKKIPLPLEEAIERLIRDWQGNIFPAEELKHLMQELLHGGQREGHRDPNLQEEIDNAFQAITTGKAPRDIRLETPERQLVWAAHILFLIYNPYLMRVWPENRRKGGFDLVKSALWQQLLQCHQVKYLRAIFGSHVYNLLRRTDILVGWGAPGTWFFYAVNPPPGRIHCDLLYSLLVGFDHARACAVHEIGHAVQTRGIPDYIQDLNAAVRDSQAEDEALEAQQALQLQQYFLNACEDNCVNRYTAEIGKVLGQDYAYSLGYWYTAIGDIGRRFTRKEVVYGEDTPQLRFKNLTFIISRFFCANSGLFPNTYEGWESVMARPEWVQGRDRNAPETQLPQQAAFQQLREMCEEVEHYFPDLAEMAGGPEYYGELAETYAQKRFELIHEIWRLHAQDIVDQILEKKEEDLDDSMDRFQMEMNHTPPPPKRKEQEKDPEEDKDKNSEDNPNPPSEADKDSKKKMEEPEDGSPPPDDQPPPEDESGGGDGEDESAGDSAESPPEDSNDAGDDGDQQEEDQEQGSEPDSGGAGAPQDPTQKPEQQDKEEKEEDKQDRQEKEMEGPPPEGAETKPDEALQQDETDRPDELEQKDAPPEPPEEISPEELEQLMEQLLEQFKELVEFKEDSTAEEEVVEDEENPEAELIREVEDDALPPEQKPEEEKNKDDGGDRGDAHGGDADSTGVLDRESLPEESMASIEELLEALKANEESPEEQEERRKPQDREVEEKERLKFDIPPPMSLDQLAKGDWEDFNRRVALHGPVIALMARALERLKQAQLKLIFRISKKHQLIPPGGDLRRFDQAKMQNLIERIAKQEKFDKDHLSMFRKDDRISAVTRPTRIILIDGSRSMTFGAQPLPMDKAIQEAVIDYMASRIAGYDTYITMFGPQNPILLAQPGDNPVEIGKRIEKVHGGLNTMTYLAPALLQVIEKVAYRKQFEESFVGFTNFVIYTDGDIDDLKASRELIQQIITHAPKSTFDFVMITDKHATPMDVLIRTLDIRNPLHEIGCVRSTAKRHYPLALTATMKLTERLGKAKSGFADPAFLRTGQFRRLLHLLTR